MVELYIVRGKEKDYAIRDTAGNIYFTYGNRTNIYYYQKPLRAVPFYRVMSGKYNRRVSFKKWFREEMNNPIIRIHAKGSK